MAQLALLFTGQGAQRAGMGSRLYHAFPVVRRELEAMDREFSRLRGESLLELMFAEDSERLHRTEYTQPALFALEVALARVLIARGLQPHLLLGHSVGELAAACVAGVFSVTDGLALTTLRGQLMQALPAGGTMLALRAGEDLVREVSSNAGLRFDIAALNGPQATVISGAAGEVARAKTAFEELGVVGQELAVSHAFHSSLMDPMLPEFARTAATFRFRAPRIPMISNLTGELFSAHEIPDADYWTRHVREPVRFRDGVVCAAAQGCDVFLELGPQTTLIGLTRRCLGRSTVRFIETLSRDRDEAESFAEALESLGALGLMDQKSVADTQEASSP